MTLRWSLSGAPIWPSSVSTLKPWCTLLRISNFSLLPYAMSSTAYQQRTKFLYSGTSTREQPACMAWGHWHSWSRHGEVERFTTSLSMRWREPGNHQHYLRTSGRSQSHMDAPTVKTMSHTRLHHHQVAGPERRSRHQSIEMNRLLDWLHFPSLQVLLHDSQASEEKA